MPKFASLFTTSRCSRKVLHFVSFALLYIPNCVSFYWGNLVVYLTSYWFAKQEVFQLQTPWFLSIYVISWSTCYILASNLVKKLNQGIISFTGVLLFDSGIFLSYFSVKYSTTALNCTMGLLTGAGLGFIQAEIFIRLSKLVTSKAGLAFALLNNCFNVGAAIYDAVITWYTNPDNVEADVVIGRTKVFSDRSVIDRVPSLFIVLGIMTSVSHFSGLIMMFILKDKDGASSISRENCFKAGKQESTPIKKEFNQSSYRSRESIASSNSASDLSIPKNCLKNSGQNIKPLSNNRCGDHKNFEDISENQRQVDRAVEKTSISLYNDKCSEISLSPWEALKTLKFYILWFTVFANDTSYIVLFNYFKVFGELWIPDDHFLTDLGIVSVSAVIIMRLVWGVILDILTVKTANVIFTASSAISFFLYYFTPQINRWLYALWTIILTTLSAAVYLNFPVMTLKLFGPAHFGSNYGIIATATIVLNIIAPLTLKNVLQYFGWPTLFIATGALNALALTANVFGLPNRH